MDPFLKWVGGKRWLIPVLRQVIQPSKTYYEPFLGSGAVYFALNPPAAELSDTNIDLVASFNAVKHRPLLVSEQLSSLNIDPQIFHAMRESTPYGFVTRAARLIYLNRTAFNGIYRVNRKGAFNVPYGCKPGTRLPDSAHLLNCSAALAAARVRCRDFEIALAECSAGDLVYADPPYTTKHCNGSFRRYNENLFSWKDQVRLATCLSKHARNGVSIVISNSASNEVVDLYSKHLFRSIVVRRASNLAAASTARGTTTESIIVSLDLYPAIAEARKQGLPHFLLDDGF